MAAEPVDLVVSGGGIRGAGIARDAALRGLRTALVDKGDFAGATSSRSSRLIHGGLRYLEQYDFHLVREASRERRLLLDLAPHLVRPLAFLFPVYRGARVAAWRLRAGMWLYDLLAAFRNVRLHRWLSRRAALKAEPGLRERGLVGAALYYDAQTDDARLVLAAIRGAAQAGALAANYPEGTSLARPDGRVPGFRQRRRLPAALGDRVLSAGPPRPARRDLHLGGPAALACSRARARRVGGASGAPHRREPQRLDHHRRRQAHDVPRHGARHGRPRGPTAARARWPADPAPAPHRSRAVAGRRGGGS